MSIWLFDRLTAVKRLYRKLAAHALTLELVAIPGLLPINAPGF
jgi:hypothetical protein